MHCSEILRVRRFSENYTEDSFFLERLCVYSSEIIHFGRIDRREEVRKEEQVSTLMRTCSL